MILVIGEECANLNLLYNIKREQKCKKMYFALFSMKK